MCHFCATILPKRTVKWMAVFRQVSLPLIRQTDKTFQTFCGLSQSTTRTEATFKRSRIMLVNAVNLHKKKNLGKSAWRNVSPLNEITYWKFKFLLKWLGFTHGFHQAMINVTAPIVHPLTIGWAYDAFVLQQSHFQGNQPTASFYCSFFVLLCSFFGLF